MQYPHRVCKFGSSGKEADQRGGFLSKATSVAPASRDVRLSHTAVDATRRLIPQASYSRHRWDPPRDATEEYSFSESPPVPLHSDLPVAERATARERGGRKAERLSFRFFPSALLFFLLEEAIRFLYNSP